MRTGDGRGAAGPSSLRARLSARLVSAALREGLRWGIAACRGRMQGLPPWSSGGVDLCERCLRGGEKEEIKQEKEKANWRRKRRRK